MIQLLHDTNMFEKKIKSSNNENLIGGNENALTYLVIGWNSVSLSSHYSLRRDGHN